MPFKLIVFIFLALAAAVGAGWLVGASGRSVVEIERSRMEMRAEYAESRALVQDGRVSLFLNHTGDAIQRFQNARTLIGRLQVQLREIGQVEQAGRLEIAISHLSDAQRATAAFDSERAQGSAEQAVEALRAAAGGPIGPTSKP